MNNNKSVIIVAIIIVVMAIAYILYLGWENRNTSKLSSSEIKELKMKAQHDNMEAIAKLSSYYESVNDRTNAIYWLEILANKGDKVSAYHLYYLLSEGNARDRNKALAYLIKSAESGYAIAQWKLSQLYTEGVLVPKDQYKAKYWADKSRMN